VLEIFYLGITTGTTPSAGVCSDGINFWITLPANGTLMRF
jgi:fibrillarin-like rRNA methylase